MTGTLRKRDDRERNSEGETEEGGGDQEGEVEIWKGTGRVREVEQRPIFIPSVLQPYVAFSSSSCLCYVWGRKPSLMTEFKFGCLTATLTCWSDIMSLSC